MKKKKTQKNPRQTNKQTKKTCDWDKLLLLLRHHKLLRQVWYY